MSSATLPFVVAGAAGDIGSAIALRLQDRGGRVIGLDVRDREGLTVTDLTSEADVQRVASDLLDQVGAIEGIAVAVGLLESAPLPSMTLQQFRTVMDSNVLTVFLVLKHLGPLVRDGGSITVIGSVAAHCGTDTTSVYTAAKGAVISLVKAASQEFAPRGVRVNVVSPGWVDAGFTALLARSSPDPDQLRLAAARAHLLGRMAAPSEVADAVEFLSSDKASFITGTELFVDGGFMVRR